jgi:hypothetical protein
VEAFQSGAWFNTPYANMIFSLFFLICATSSEFWYFHFLIQCISFEQSKYIAQLKEKAEIRKREQDIIYERKLQKERSKEDHLFGDKDKFVTSAYRKKLEEQQKWLEEERIRQLREEKEDVSFIHLFAVILCTCIFVFMSSLNYFFLFLSSCMFTSVLYSMWYAIDIIYLFPMEPCSWVSLVQLAELRVNWMATASCWDLCFMIYHQVSCLN